MATDAPCPVAEPAGPRDLGSESPRALSASAQAPWCFPLDRRRFTWTSSRARSTRWVLTRDRGRRLDDRPGRVLHGRERRAPS